MRGRTGGVSREAKDSEVQARASTSTRDNMLFGSRKRECRGRGGIGRARDGVLASRVVAPLDSVHIIT